MSRKKLVGGWLGCLVVSLLTLYLFAAPPPKVVDLSVGKNTETDLLEQLPLFFEPNRGQVPGPSRFVSRGPGYLLTLEEMAAELRVGKSGKGKPLDNLLRMELLGATTDGAISGLDELPGRVSYFRGRDAAGWVTDLPVYKSIGYKEIYPGTDLVFYGNPRQLEFDFVLQPGARADRIRLIFNRPYRLDEKGQLLFQTAQGQIELRAPVAYQETDSGGRNPVSSEYAALGDRQVGFRLGHYDPSRPLIVDPVLSYSSFLGGPRSDVITDVVLDSEGNIYLTGITESASFPGVDTGVQEEAAGGQEVFVSKLNPAADTLLFSTFLGGTGNDQSNTLAVDEEGKVYLAGSTDSTDFPLEGAFQEAAGGRLDAFVSKLSASGSTLIFSTYLGGARDDFVVDLAVQAGEAFLTGSTRSDDFPLLAPLQEEAAGRQDAFVTSLSASGSELNFSTYLGGALDDVGRAIVVDETGRPFVVGSTRSTDFPTALPLQEENARSDDTFISKLEADGSALLFSTYVGGRSSDLATLARLDPEGDLWVGGETNSNDFPLVDALGALRGGGTDVFLLRVPPDGDRLIYSTVIGGSGTDSPRGLAIDQQGQLYVGGATNSNDFPGLGPLQLGVQGTDAFLLKLAATGSRLLFSTSLGGPFNDIVSAMALDGEGRAYLVGSTDLPGLPTVNPFQATLAGDSLFATSNAADSWSPTGSGLENPNVRVLTVEPVEPTILYAGTLGGVFKSTDWGATWSGLGLETEDIRSIAVDPTDNQILYAASSFLVFKSTDGGENWEVRVTNLPLGTPLTGLAIDPADSSVLYLITRGRGIFKTTDGAEMWRASNNGLDGVAQQVFAIALDPHNSSRIFIGTQGTVYSSSNAGVTWSPTSLTGVSAVTAVVFDNFNSDIVYAAALSPFGNLVARTEDGGTAWTTGLPLEAPVTSIVLDPLDGTVLFAGTAGGGVLKSTDSGMTWEAANSGLENLQIDALVIDPRNRSTLLVGVETGSDGFLMRVDPTQVFYFPQVGDGIAGDIRLQTALIFVNTGEATQVRVEFFDSAGNPLSLTVEGFGAVSEFEIALGKGEAVSLKTSGQDPLKVGYARVSGSDRVGGTAVFVQTDAETGRLDYEAGVPASFGQPSVSVFLDSLGNRDTGLALVHAVPTSLIPTSEAAQVTVTLFDKDSNLLDSQQIELDLDQHQAQFIRELFPEIADQASEMQGIIRVQSDRPVAALTLRQTDDPEQDFPRDIPILTSFSAFPEKAARRVVYFPQIADGIFGNSRFQTSLILVNTGSSNLTLTVEFFDSEGMPLEMNLGDAGVDSVFVLRNLAPSRFVVLETSGEEAGKAGYARLTSTSDNFGSTAVFQEQNNDGGVFDGVAFYEAGVPTSAPQDEFSVFVDTLGVLDTGLAMVNAAEETGTITLRLYDKSFNLIAEVVLEVGAGQQVARFVWQFFPEIEAQVREMEGVLTVESTVPLAAVTLRQNDNPTREFPSEVPTLTTFPVIPGRAQP